MNALRWTLVILGWLVIIYWILRVLRWSTYVPIPGRQQDVRAVCRRQAQWDIEAAVAEALQSARLETSARSEGAG